MIRRRRRRQRENSISGRHSVPLLICKFAPLCSRAPRGSSRAKKKKKTDSNLLPVDANDAPRFIDRRRVAITALLARLFSFSPKKKKERKTAGNVNSRRAGLLTGALMIIYELDTILFTSFHLILNINNNNKVNLHIFKGHHAPPPPPPPGPFLCSKLVRGSFVVIMLSFFASSERLETRKRRNSC